MKFNINEYIKVKLTPKGHEILEGNHDELTKKFPSIGFKYTPPEEDEDGYSKFQGWILMETFGPHMWNGCQMPFDAKVIIG